MPYLYTAVREAHDTGMPIMRALWLHYPGDPRSTARGDEYLWGRDILVAPVVEKGTTHRKLYLPPGLWYDYWSRTPFMGGQEITRYVNLSTMPLYVRAGPSCRSTRRASTSTSRPTSPPRLPSTRARTASSCSTKMTERASTTFAMWPPGHACAWDDRARQLTIEPHEKSTSKPGQPRRFVVRLVPANSARTVDYAGDRLLVKFD